MELTFSDYELYQRRVSVAVRSFQQWNGVSGHELAKACNLAQGTFYAKVAQRRKWNLQDLIALANAGVRIPPFQNDTYRRAGIQTRPKANFEVLR